MLFVGPRQAVREIGVAQVEAARLVEPRQDQYTVERLVTVARPSGAGERRDADDFRYL